MRKGLEPKKWCRMSKRNYAALMHDYLDEMSELTDAEFGRLCRMLLTYSITGEQLKPSGNERFYIKRIIAQEDRMQDSYSKASEARRQNGAMGGRPKKTEDNQAKPKKPSETEDNQAKPKKPNSNSSSNTSSISPNGETPPLPPSRGRKCAERFTPPTLAEVQSYVAERHSPVDPQGFIDFYAAKGWMVGKTPMKDWKAACRNAEHWERWSNKSAFPTPAKPGEAPRVPSRAKQNAEWMREMLESDGEEEH